MAAGGDILRGGSAVIDAGGTATSLTIEYGGSETISTGGVDSGALVADSGNQIILSGGAAIGATIASGGTQTIDASGAASDSYVQSGGIQIIESGGAATSATIASGGTQTIDGGGVASDSDVQNGGIQIIGSGGAAVSATVESGGVQDIESGAVASDTMVSSGGSVTVAAGASAVGVIVQSGGVEDVAAGGTTISTTLGAGGLAFVVSGATASDTDVLSGGIEFVASGGNAISTIIESGATLVVLPGADISATVESGGSAVSTGVVVTDLHSFVEVEGASTYALLISGSGMVDYVLTGGTVTSTQISDNGLEIVLAGGLAINTSIGDPSEQIVSGSAVSTIVGSTGDMLVASGGTAVSTIVQGGGTMLVDSGATIDMTSLSLSAVLDLTYATFSSGGSAVLSGGILTIDEGATSVSVALAGDYTGEYFHLGNDGDGGTDITVDGVPCYCRGTMILTEQGEVAVEDLRIGDRLVTADGRLRPLRWIGTRAYSPIFARGNRDVLPVRIARGALGHNTPHRDLLVSPLHAMFIDGMLVPAGALVNGTSIVQLERPDEIAYFHLELDTHDIIVAEGALGESFVNEGNRGMFHNAASFARLYPHAPDTQARYCAPRVEDGACLDRIRRAIAARAARCEDAM